MRKKSLGNLGENLALKHLKKNGYKIINRNFESKYGEIDVIARDGKTLVFIEVKTRSSDKFGYPEKAITPWKIKRMAKTAQYYLTRYPREKSPFRLDAVAISLDESGKIDRIKIIKNISQ